MVLLLVMFCSCAQVMEDTLANTDAKAAVLASSKPGCFIAGADIGWLDSAKDKTEVIIMIVELLCLAV